MDEIVFTPAAVLDFMRQIDELKDVDISLVDDPGSSIQFQIGSSAYTINTNNVTDIKVSEDIVEEVSDANVSAYSDMESSDVQVDELEDIKSGLLKEIGKTLLIGGLVRLTNKLLGKDRDKR